MSSLSLLVVPCPQLKLLLFCFLAGGDPSAGCLSRLSRTGFAFFEDLLAEVDDDAAAAAAAATAVVASVGATTVFVAVEVVVVTVVAVTALMTVVATADVEFTATVTDLASLLLDFRFLDRKTTSGVDVVVILATDFSTLGSDFFVQTVWLSTAGGVKTGSTGSTLLPGQSIVTPSSSSAYDQVFTFASAFSFGRILFGFLSNTVRLAPILLDAIPLLSSPSPLLMSLTLVAPLVFKQVVSLSE